MKNTIHIVLATALATAALHSVPGFGGHAQAVTTAWLETIVVEGVEPEAGAKADDDVADDAGRPFPKKKHGRSTPEKLLSAPGWLIASPFIVFSYLAGAAIALDEEYAIVQRTHALLTSEDGRRGLAPVYSSLGGYGVKLYAKDHFNEDFRSSLTAAWSTKGRAFYQGQWRRLNLWDGFITTGFRIQYRDLPDERFFGIGPNSTRDDETNFQQLQPLTELAIGRRFTDRFQANLVLGYERDQIKHGKGGGSPSTTKVFDAMTLAGLERTASMARVGVDVMWDRSNRMFRPSSGFHLLAEAAAVYEPDHTSFGFTTFGLDLSWFYDIYYERIVAIRVAGQFNDPFDDRAIPFYKLAELGSTETIRGYTRGRFRGRDAVWTTVEYRYPIWRILDGMLFGDFGYVSQDVFESVFRIDDVIWSFGGGIRMWGREGAQMSAELGYGEDGFRFHFVLN